MAGVLRYTLPHLSFYSRAGMSPATFISISNILKAVFDNRQTLASVGGGAVGDEEGLRPA